jgi:excisionase family DNA binding protein
MEIHPVPAPPTTAKSATAAANVNTNMHDTRDILDVDGLSIWLHIHPTTVRSHAAQGLIPGRQIGNRWRFSRTRIEAWLSEAA